MQKMLLRMKSSFTPWINGLLHKEIYMSPYCCNIANDCKVDFSSEYMISKIKRTKI